MNNSEIERYNDEYNKRVESNRFYSKKQAEFRQMTTDQYLNLDIIWQDTIQQVDEEFLKSSVDALDLTNFVDDFEIINLNLDLFLISLFSDKKKIDEIFPRNKLWDTDRKDVSITKLICRIENKESICPPIIGLTSNDYIKEPFLALFDGNHRIALSRFLKIESIPFIKRKADDIESFLIG